MITWIKDPFQSEAVEFKRHSDYKGHNAVARTKNFQYLKLIYGKSNKIALNDQTWKQMINTGSWSAKKMDDLFKNLRMDGVRRNVSRIVTQFIGNGEVNDWNGRVSCPIVCKYTDGSHELIAGNTRLTMAKILNIRPQVIILRTNW
jgi:hypothetical protein